MVSETQSFLGLVNYCGRFIPDLATISEPLRCLTKSRVVSYASRSLTDTERRYSQTEKEALALVWACEKFHPYMYGVPFELVTDHKPLEVIYGLKSKPCARIARWVLRMQPYKFKVKYEPGLKNIADPLSRLVGNQKTSSSHSSEAEEYIRFVAVNATPCAMTT